MPSPAIIEIVKSTLPFLRERGVDLTRRMYELLFEDVDIRALFNASQQGPDGAQPRALAMAVLAYGEHIERPEMLAAMIERIAHRHVSLGIEARHYPIVGNAILHALRELLADAPNSELTIAAWGEAYGELAAIFIQRERTLADTAKRQPGGWTGWRPFRVDRIVAESCNVKSFYLVPSDGGRLSEFLPGQYLTMTFDGSDNAAPVRSYSLSNAPRCDRYRISVKREPEGSMSKRLHDEVEVGSLLNLRAPAGNFTIAHGETPIVLLSGGVGATPCMSMLENHVATGANRPMLWAHATQDGTHHAFKMRVRSLAAVSEIRTMTWYEVPLLTDISGFDYDHVGLVTADTLTGAARWLTEADVYVCGPKPFMRVMHQMLSALDLPPAQSHFEVFGPDDIQLLLQGSYTKQQ